MQQYFEVILESEVHLDKSKSYLTSCEKNEIKLRKECDKLNDRNSHDVSVLEERKVLNDRLLHAAASINAAQQEGRYLYSSSVIFYMNFTNATALRFIDERSVSPLFSALFLYLCVCSAMQAITMGFFLKI